MDIKEYVVNVARKAQQAYRKLSTLSTDIKNKALLYMAQGIEDNMEVIKAENWKASLDTRIGETAFHRYQDILFPSLPEKSIISLQEGDTPLYDVSYAFPDFKSLKLKRTGILKEDR